MTGKTITGIFTFETQENIIVPLVIGIRRRGGSLAVKAIEIYAQKIEKIKDAKKWELQEKRKKQMN